LIQENVGQQGCKNDGMCSSPVDLFLFFMRVRKLAVATHRIASFTCRRPGGRNPTSAEGMRTRSWPPLQCLRFPRRPAGKAMLQVLLTMRQGLYECMDKESSRIHHNYIRARNMMSQ
jgi:hypothetical protein